MTFNGHMIVTWLTPMETMEGAGLPGLLVGLDEKRERQK